MIHDNDYSFYEIYKQQHRELVKQAEIERLLKASRQNQPPLWQRLSANFSALFRFAKQNNPAPERSMPTPKLKPSRTNKNI